MLLKFKSHSGSTWYLDPERIISLSEPVRTTDNKITQIEYGGQDRVLQIWVDIDIETCQTIIQKALDVTRVILTCVDNLDEYCYHGRAYASGSAYISIANIAAIIPEHRCIDQYVYEEVTTIYFKTDIDPISVRESPEKIMEIIEQHKKEVNDLLEAEYDKTNRGNK